MVLNVGNSRLGIGVFVAGELKHSSRVPLADGSELRRQLAEAWKLLASTQLPAVAGASVNSAAQVEIEAIVAEICPSAVQWVGRQLDLPIDVQTDAPAQTGVDRVLNIAAAYEQMGKACVVVDAGTAVTVDCCDDSGAFLGGAIAPGVSLMLDALHEKTAALPRVEFAAPTGAFGRDTNDAIRQGVYHGIRGMVRELVENYATQLGHWPDVIATGGDAADLFAGWELIHAVSPDLTFYGIALAYADHHIRHDEGM